MPENRRRAVERQVRNDAKRLARKVDRGRVPADDLDVVPAAAQAIGPEPVELDRDDVPRRLSERLGQAAAAGAEVENEVVGPNAGVADDIRGNGTSEEVLATRAARATRRTCASIGHGRSRL